MTDDDFLEAYRLMVLLREFDQKAVSLQRQGRLGTLSTARGQEAAIAGAVCALDPARDWVVPQYRELTALTRHGFPLSAVFCHYMGNPGGDRIPDDVRMLPVQISLAAQLPHAVGLAWGEMLQGRDGAALVFFGDGASSEGDFHEACNLAGVLRAPVVFFLQDNGWAISTPRARQTAAERFAARAEGYGIHGETVDGNDVEAVHAAVARAVERGRAGEGATLIEAVTYRLGAHSTADDPTRYVPPQELEEATARDPFAVAEARLAERGLLAGGDAERIADEAREAVASALEEAQQIARPALGDLLGELYHRPPGRLQRQIAALAEDEVAHA